MTEFYDPLSVRKSIQHWADQKQPTEFEKSHSGALIGHLNDELAQFDAEGKSIKDINRRLVIMWLVSRDDDYLIDPVKFTTNDLTPQEWNGIKRWVDAKKVNGVWIPRAHFGAEARWILNCARFDLSRVTLNDKVLVMSDFIEFWKEHLPATDDLGEMGISSLHVGGIPAREDAPLIERSGDFVEENEPLVGAMAILAEDQKEAEGNVIDLSDIMPI